MLFIKDVFKYIDYMIIIIILYEKIDYLREPYLN